MTKSFDEIVSNYQDPQPEWTVSINGKDYSNNIDLIEFTDSVNNPLKITVKLEGIDSSDDIPEDAEIIIGRKSAQLFRGVLKQVNPNALNSYTFKGTGYAAELESNSEQILSDEGVGERFEDSTVQTVVDTLVDGASMPNSRTFSTSYSGGIASTVVDDFRVKKEQIEDVNRLMGEYDIEWYTTTDGSNNPVFNVTDQISFTDGGSPIDTITTYGGNQSAEMVEQNVNRNKGDFDGVVVRGYGDGDDQITASAGNTGKGNRVLFYTDKTIVTSSQAQKRADNLADTQTVAWQEIEVKPSNPNNVYGVGDELKIESKEARLNDTYRVVKTYFKIWPGEDQFESKLNLSNKPQTFIDDFKEQQNQTDSQTDYMQGARNVWGDKEAANATNADPLEIDFEVPQDVVDIAENNRLDRVEFNYACTPFRQTGDPQTITAENFDPGIKSVETSVNTGGVEMERERIVQHNHPVGSSTSQGGTGRDFLGSSGGFNFTNNIPSSGWQRLGGQAFSGTSPPENDLAHAVEFEIASITPFDQPQGSTVVRDLHYAIVAGDPVANFSYTPLSPSTVDTVRFEENTTQDIEQTAVYFDWDLGDGTTFDGSTLQDNGEVVTHSYSSSGTYTVTMEARDSNDNLIDDVSKDIEVRVANSNSLSLPDSPEKLSEEQREVLDDAIQSKAKSESVESQDISAQNDPDVNVALGDPDQNNVTQWIFDDNTETVTYDGSVVNESSTNYNGFEIELRIFKLDPSQFAGGEVIQAEEVVDTQTTSAGFVESYSFDRDFDDFDDDSTFEGQGEVYYKIIVYDLSGNILDEVYQREGGSGRQAAHFLAEPKDFTEITAITDGNGNDATQGDTLTSANIDIETKSIHSGRTEGIDLTIDEDGGTQNPIRDVEISSSVDDAFIELGLDEIVTFTINGQEYSVVNEGVNGDTADVFFDGSVSQVDQGETFSIQGIGFKAVKCVEDGGYEGFVFSTYLTETNNFNLSAGSFTANLEAEHEERDGSYTITRNEDFTISLNQPPTAEFSFSPTSPDSFEAITFTDESTDPDGSGDLDTWEWDFGDGTTQTINNAPGDTTHSYSSSGSYDVTLTVTDDSGVQDTHTETVNVGGIDALDNTVVMSGVRNVGSTPMLDSQVVSNANTIEQSGVTNVGTQVSPAGDTYMTERVHIPYRQIAGSYEIYVATQGSGDCHVIGGVELRQLNHFHDMPRQDDFDGADPDIGSGAENKEIPFQKSTGNRGDVNLDFSTNDESIVLDTTENGNDVTITVANEDGSGNFTNTEQITANDGTATTTNTYQDAELYIRIDSASDEENFEVRDVSGDDAYTLAAVTLDSFQSDKTSQQKENVSDGDGEEQDIIEDVPADLLQGSTANNVQIFIDDQPDSGGNTEQEITGDLYGGSNDSGTAKDKELDISDYVDSPGWYRLKIVPDQASFVKSRVFLDHHKDTE